MVSVCKDCVKNDVCGQMEAAAALEVRVVGAVTMDKLATRFKLSAPIICGRRIDKDKLDD